MTAYVKLFLFFGVVVYIVNKVCSGTHATDGKTILLLNMAIQSYTSKLPTAHPTQLSATSNLKLYRVSRWKYLLIYLGYLGS